MVVTSELYMDATAFTFCKYFSGWKSSPQLTIAKIDYSLGSSISVIASL